MDLSVEMLQNIDNLAKAIIEKSEYRLIRRIVTSFTNSDEEVPSSKLVNTAINGLTSSKADKTNGSSQITDNNSNNYSQLGNLNSGATQQTINSAINSKLNSLDTNINGLLIDNITDGDTSHAVTPNAVYDYVNDTIGDIEEDMLS